MNRHIATMALVWVGIAACALAQDPDDLLTFEEAHEGFVPLFNGMDLSGWWIRGEQGGFVAEGGSLVTLGEPGGDYIFADREYANFVFRYQYKVQTTGEGNSGVAIRTPKAGDPAFQGMEIQVIRPNWEVPYQRSGALYSVVPPQVAADKPAGEWNDVEILCDGTRIRTTMNGQVLYDIKTTDYPVTKDWQKKLTDRPMKGYIGFQNHGNRVEFRMIRLKELPGQEN